MSLWIATLECNRWVVWMCDILLNQQWQLFSSTVFPINPPSIQPKTTFLQRTHLKNTQRSCVVEYARMYDCLPCVLLKWYTMFIPQGIHIHTLLTLPSYPSTHTHTHTHTHTPARLLLLYRDPFVFTCYIQIKQHVWAGGWFIYIYISVWRKVEQGDIDIDIRTQYVLWMWVLYVLDICEQVPHLTDTSWEYIDPNHQNIDFWLVKEHPLCGWIGKLAQAVTLLL